MQYSVDRPRRAHRTSLLPAAVSLALAGLTVPGLAQTWEAEAEALFLASPGTGFVVENAGDVDGDGRNDALVSRIDVFNNRGRVFLVSSDGVLLHTFTGVTQGDNLGHSVAGVGDTDGDGMSDVVVGAPVLGGNRPGSVMLRSGATGDLLWSWSGEAAGDLFGWVVAGAGDVDGDGCGDVVVGAPGHDLPASNAGKVYVYSGATGSLLYSWTGGGAGDSLGVSVGSAGDRHADGHYDVIACAVRAGAGNDGQAYIYAGLDGSVICTIDAPATAAQFGNYFSGLAGDVDADGLPDVYVIDYLQGQQRGRLNVYSGADCTRLLTIRGPLGSQYLFGRVRAGDVDGDGHDDLVVCSGQNNDGGAAAGALYLYSGATGESLGQFTGDTAGMRLGTDCAGLGDVTGDGVPDFVVGVGVYAGVGGLMILSGAPNPPRNTCESSANSTGLAARMDYRGSLVRGQAGFELHCDQVLPAGLGIFFGGLQASSLPFGDGIRCVAAPLRRHGYAVADSAGHARLALDTSVLPVSSAWTFQLWYRDGAAGGAGFNLSDSLRATFRD